jgi:hypothetical protein
MLVTIPVGRGGNRPWLRGDGFIVRGDAGLANLSSVLDLAATRRRLFEHGEVVMAGQRLPSSWVEPMRQPGVTGDATPWEFSYIAANDLAWSPNPVLQTFVAWTPALDRLSARHFSGDRAPDFVLMEWIELDGRHPLATAPETWRAVLANYDMIRILAPAERAQLRLASPWSVALLQRRDTPRGLDLVEHSVGRADFFTPIPVPETETLLFLELDLRTTFSGAFMKLAAQIPPVHMRIYYETGQTVTFRVVPDTLRNAIMVQPFPLAVEEFRVAADRRLGPRITAVAIEGPGTYDFMPTFSYRWLASTDPIAAPAAPPEGTADTYLGTGTVALSQGDWSAQETRTYSVTLTNEGTSAWHHSGPHPVMLGIQFSAQDATSDADRATDQQFALDRDVLPGESVTLSVAVVAPARSGAYVLRHRLLAQGLTWSGQVDRRDVRVK